MSRSISQHTGISFSRLLLLHELMHEGELSQAELQRRLRIEGALVTRFLKQMEMSGLVARRADPKDNRYTLVALTSIGRAEIKKMDTLRAQSEHKLLLGIREKDKKVVIGALKKILENITQWQA